MPRPTDNVTVTWGLLQRVYSLLDTVEPNRPETAELYAVMEAIDDAEILDPERMCVNCKCCRSLKHDYICPKCMAVYRESIRERRESDHG